MSGYQINRLYIIVFMRSENDLMVDYFDTIAINSDFERIRGRDKDSRTQEYNYFLLSNGFTVIKEIDTC